MKFGDTLTRLDAARLQQTARATIQSNGRLLLSVEATRLMKLADESSLIVFAAENGDLGATVSVKGDPQAFELKRAGATYYLTFKAYLEEAGINYKTQRIVFDITRLDEEIDGHTLFRFARHVLPKESSGRPLSNSTVPCEPNFANEETPTPCAEAPAEEQPNPSDDSDTAVSASTTNH